MQVYHPRSESFSEKCQQSGLLIMDLVGEAKEGGKASRASCQVNMGRVHGEEVPRHSWWKLMIEGDRPAGPPLLRSQTLVVTLSVSVN